MTDPIEAATARVHELEERFRALCDALDDASDRGARAEVHAIELRLYGVERDLDAAEARLDRLTCNAAREAAEARLAYHDEHDTLDLY